MSNEDTLSDLPNLSQLHYSNVYTKLNDAQPNEKIMAKEKSQGWRVYDRDGFVRRAACLCFKDDNQSEVLLISSKKLDKWIVPGGGVEPAEDPLTTARRELMEEAGTSGTIIRCLGTFQNHERCHRTLVFSMKAEYLMEEWEEGMRGRRRKWFTIPDAIEALTKSKIMQLYYLKLHFRSTNPLLVANLPVLDSIIELSWSELRRRPEFSFASALGGKHRSRLRRNQTPFAFGDAYLDYPVVVLKEALGSSSSDSSSSAVSSCCSSLYNSDTEEDLSSPEGTDVQRVENATLTPLTSGTLIAQLEEFQIKSARAEVNQHEYTRPYAKLSDIFAPKLDYAVHPPLDPAVSTTKHISVPTSPSIDLSTPIRVTRRSRSLDDECLNTQGDAIASDGEGALSLSTTPVDPPSAENSITASSSDS